MRKTIERNIIVNTVFSKSLDVDFKVKDNEPFEMYGKITKEEAEKEAINLYGKGTVLLKVITSNNRYIIEVKDFIKNAKIKNE